MNTEKALEFLKNNQPLPSDDLISQENLDLFSEVINWFVENPDERCIPLLLNSFGKGSAYGLYQNVEEVLLKFSKEIIVSHLIQTLNSKDDNILYWNCQFAGSFPDIKLIEPLSKLINSDKEDVRVFALSALGFIKTAKAKELISNRLKIEKDDYVKETISDILSELG